MGSSLLIRIAFVICVTAWSAITIREPLWIDELHTLWSIQDDWHDVFVRSTEGNQSPLYFYFLKAYVELIQLPLKTIGFEFSSFNGIMLRSFSLIGWGILAWLMSGQILSSRKGLETKRKAVDLLIVSILFVGGLWLMSDRSGGFYATEARPYVWVAVACFLMMNTTIPRVGSSWQWLLYGLTAFYLHYTAIFVVGASFFLRSLARYRDVCSRRFIVYEGFVLALLMTPGLLYLWTLSKTSSQWAYFAGRSDLFTLLRVSPWFAWVCVPSLFVGLIWILRLKNTGPMALATGSSIRRLVVGTSFDAPPRASAHGSGKIPFSPLFVAVLLTLICLGTNWGLCFIGWAPLMHSRYLIGIYPAIWIAGMLLLTKLNCVRWVLAIGFLALGVQGWLQGSWPLWGRGEFIAWQRSEDWEMAFEVLQENKQAGDLVFLAPMLIETENQRLIDASSETRQDYFAFAIESLFTQRKLIAPEPIFVLANSPSSWTSTIEANLDSTNNIQGRIWLLARTSQPWTIVDAGKDRPFKRELMYQAGNLQLWQLQFLQ